MQLRSKLILHKAYWTTCKQGYSKPVGQMNQKMQVGIQKELLAVQSFKSFQQQRNNSGLEKSELIEILELAGASYDIF